ncbi:MAG: glycosyltransferase family 2 protein [Bacilli bacterium]|nr:glycosyltransferase family 2 protein [Bacilli bacterium]
MKRVFFVILHYQNIDDTIHCVDSIDSLNAPNIEKHIVLIDNHSPNRSGEELQKKYQNKKNCQVLLLDKNYGFTIANNKGYQIAKESNADVIMVLNNDILFEDSTFLEKLMKEYKDYDVIAPDIINIQDRHQNPLREEPYTLKKAYKNLLFQRLSFIFYHIPYLNKLFLKWNQKREQKWLDNYFKEKNNNIDIHHFVPFGAFIIYTGKYIKNEEKAFVGTSFMYMEEEFLGLYLKVKQYRLFYNSDLKVRHLEGRSTQYSLDNEIKRLIFRTKNQAKAIQKYIKFYKRMVK